MENTAITRNTTGTANTGNTIATANTRNTTDMAGRRVQHAAAVETHLGESCEQSTIIHQPFQGSIIKLKIYQTIWI